MRAYGRVQVINAAMIPSHTDKHMGQVTRRIKKQS